MTNTRHDAQAVRLPEPWQAAVGAVLALVLWAGIFGLKLVNFWLGLSCAAMLLAGLSIFWAGLPLTRAQITLKNTVLAVICTVLLYVIFGMGRFIAVSLLPFAGGQIGSIYAIRHEAAPGLIALVLVFLTSPCEEIFWRGFLQRWSMARYGTYRGWLLASLMYAVVHVASGNFMLTGAALVAGLFWGYVYARTRNLYVCILSHALWTVSIFLLWPMH